MWKNITILFFLIVFVSSAELRAQALTSADSSWRLEQMQGAIRLEQKEFSGPNALVYQGYEYVPYFLPVSGTPFYLSKEWQTGNVEFEGAWYHDLPLLYDVFKDQLILQSPDKMYRIALDMDKVARFTLGADHLFVRIIKNDSTGSRNIATGYYELLVEGKASLLARRSKVVNVPTEPGMSRSYRETDSYYIKKEGTYYPVRTKNSVLKVLSDQKAALKKFIRKEHINYREGREDPIITILRYYDQIGK